MKPEHLGLAHDVIDISRVQEMLPTNINLNQEIGNGKTILGHILGMLPEVSKKNPGAIELAESVINNSDMQNSKYFLARLFDFDLPNMGSLSENMKAAKEIVPTIAKDVLSGGYTMDYSKNKRFFSFIQSLCSKDSKPENLKLLKQTLDITDNVAPKVEASMNIDDIRLGDTAKIAENMEILPRVLENAEAKGLRDFDVSGFLTKNVNLK